MTDNYLMKPYDEALQEILDNGVYRTNQRTGIKTLSVFGMQKRYRLDGDRFPILSRRKVWPKSVFAELLWFLSGSTNNNDLKELGANFWTPWVDEEFEKKHGYAAGSLGKVYGFQLRHFGGEYGNGKGGPAYTEEEYERIQGIEGAGSSCYGRGGFDQLAWMVNRIKEDPSCRRTLWSLWNPQDLEQMKLAPCHYQFQIMVDDERRMTGMLNQRSADFYIGCPANITFYSALIVMLAQQTDCIPYEFVHTTADSHCYEDQLNAVKEYLSTPIVESPRLEIKKADSIFDYKMEDFILTDYNPGPVIKAPIAV